ncbi:MAG: serine/threonine-protein kinase KIN2 [Thelocarpon impressellum]|nr:MAG: serine/threonine-protein kinase KIN2 [Thelocarpon impressellum]
MSFAASSAAPALQRSHSSSRRGQAYTTAAAPSRPPRTPTSVAAPQTPGAASSPGRPVSQSYPHDRPTSSHQSRPLDNVVPRKDFETTNLARPPSSRHSSSRDRSAAQRMPSRSESTRSAHRSTSRSGHGRYAPEMSGAQAAGPSDALAPAPAPASGPGPGPENGERQGSSGGPAGKRRTTITGQSGTWALGKTIGAGSMGKVKLAKKTDTGEQVAVKIVPRQTPDDGVQSSRDRERQDHSKEIRTAREAAIVSLLDHPYVCAMRDVVRTNYHWYMLFEYVNGGQMLDYIISHGRLKEKQARKFGRQIASALDYCHRNSIVHRDLKIENILISKTGDIKIIDFGLSNLFAPRNHLRTFCGSLYFAAPELLQAKQYTGPEVDVWSFGIVLYVLVCGKVPFDDQSMPKLHAKIKKGLVDYPQWLSSECKNLISRMLVTDPSKRASLHEIITHPWICKGFNAPPENYLPHREPLSLPLDPDVIRGMTGFDFGHPDFIATQLTKVLESDDYQHAVRVAMRDRDQASSQGGGERRRGFAPFDFYKRRNSTASRDTLTNPSAEAINSGSDPINAFSPLISIYYLVREKQQRQRLEPNAGAMSIPRSPGEQPLRIPDLPAPEAAHTNDASYEIRGEKATGGRARPRARTHGEDDVTDAMKAMSLASPTGDPQTPSIMSPTLEQPVVKRESTAAGLLRRFSTRRGKDPDRDRPGKQAPPAVAVQAADEQAAPARKSFSVRKTREGEPRPISLHRTGGSQPQHQDLLAPPGAAEAEPRRSKGLGRSSSVNSAEFRRRQATRGASEVGPSITFKEPPPTSESDRSSTEGQKARASDPAQRAEKKAGPAPRSATGRTRSLGHARRESIQARRARREEAKEAKEAMLPEETDQDVGVSGASGEVAGRLDSAENVKPVYLKGLFSVSTTSPKPVTAIRAEIIRVLRQLGVEHTEVRGGFRCKHTPSIDLNKVVDNDPPSPERATNMVQSPGHRRKISFGGFRGGDDSGREQRPPPTPKTPTRRLGQDNSPTNSDMSEVSVGREQRAVGETTTHVQSELGGSMILNFEIIIVKVPILALHGLQFKRLGGGTWQYKNMADKILKELRL